VIPQSRSRTVVQASIYTCKGDSGGPLYNGHTAYGITSGMTDIVSANCGDSVIASKINNALSVLGVSLL